MQQHHLDYLMEVCERFPSIFRDEIISEVYIRSSGTNISSRDYKKYLRNLAYKVLKQLRDAKNPKNLQFDVPSEGDGNWFFQLDLDDLEAGMSQLPVNWQRVLRAASVHSNAKDAAESLEIKVDTFRKLKSRAIHRLRQWVLVARPDLTEFLK
jgi:DNA-directed RNA polymerase specialized sigma24 family protein